MKNSLAALVLLVGISTAIHARDVTLTVNSHTNVGQYGQIKLYDSVTIAVGEVATVTSVLYVEGGQNTPAPVVGVTKDGITNKVGLTSVYVDKLAGASVVGPAVIFVSDQLPAYSYSLPNSPVFLTLKIKPESFPPDKTVILPPNTGEFSVRLQTSTNLLDWSDAANGVYSTTNTARFFRLYYHKAP
jgi:hypothetical protein